jgi:hypothetical protein
VAALRAGDLESAAALLQRALEIEADSPRTWYCLGILAKRRARLEEARAALLRCRELGGRGPELDYNLGLVAIRLDDPETATRELGSVVRAGPDRAPRHYASALRRYGQALLRSGLRDESEQALDRSRARMSRGPDDAPRERGEEELEIGELFELTSFPRPRDRGDARRVPAFALRALPDVGGVRWAEIADVDGDGDRDLLLGDGQRMHDLRWTEEGWVDVTASRGLAGLLGITMARVLDLDRDGRPDLVRSGGQGVLVHPGLEGAWEPPVAICRDPAVRFAAVDFDHEGDLDIVAIGRSGPVLLRNHGDWTFSDVTGESGLDRIGPVVGLTVGDVDDDFDPDLVFVTRDARTVIASNLRGGRFEPRSLEDVSLRGAFGIVAADFDADGDLDLAVSASGGVVVLENRGELRFQTVAGRPAIAGPLRWTSLGNESMWARDFDNDGRVDLLAAREVGASLAINEGEFRFRETTAPLRPLADAGTYPVAALLIDRDRRIDLVTSRSTSGIARNVGILGSALVVEPRGTKSNRDGVGVVVELLAGSRYVRADGAGRPIHLGLGASEAVDALRVRWPDGVRQAIPAPRPGATISVEETDRPVGSCPFLYTWNGQRFEFNTDVLTACPLGLPVQPGIFLPPDHDEVVRVPAERMQPDADGFLVAQVTEELREVTYLDQVRLYAIDHAEGMEVQPNEKFSFPPFPEFGVHVLDDPRRPVSARDHRGRDVTEVLQHTDGIVVGDLSLTQHAGITEMHTLEVDFGDVPDGASLTLHLSGWLHWTSASVHLAVHQDSRHAFVPPRLQVPGPEGPGGPWVDLPIQVGFPGGMTRSIPVDVTGVFPGGRAVIRLSTTLRIYWDRAVLQIGEPAEEPAITMLLPDEAHLHFRGHSQPIPSVTGEIPERYDYNRLRTTEIPWDPPAGLYTRYGDVSPLLQTAEDRFVVMASGDECTLRWRFDRLPPLAADQRRTYFIAFEGWAKDGDLNTAFSDRVDPLPFRAMSGYPYGSEESYPEDEPHRAYRSEWNTRPAPRLIRDLPAEAASERPAPTLQETS